MDAIISQQAFYFLVEKPVPGLLAAPFYILVCFPGIVFSLQSSIYFFIK